MNLSLSFCKKWLFLLITALFGCFSLFGQDKSGSFPQNWLGKWSGTLEIYQGPTIAQTFPMSLEISTTDSAHIWNWVIIYGLDSPDVRRYLLVEEDVEKGKYVIDEQNSILLGADLFGNTLCCRFLVNHSLLLINYHFEESSLRFEVFAGPDNQGNKTGEQVESVENIESWFLQTRQQAVLTRE